MRVSHPVAGCHEEGGAFGFDCFGHLQRRSGWRVLSFNQLQINLTEMRFAIGIAVFAVVLISSIMTDQTEGVNLKAQVNATSSVHY